MFKMTSLTCLTLIISLVVTIAAQQTSNPDDEILSAFANASRSSKPTVLLISTSSCGACKIMKSTTLRDSSVVAWLGVNVNFHEIEPVTSAGDFTASAKDLGIFGVPAFVTIDTNGIEVDRHYGAFEPAGLLAYFEDVTHDRNTLADYLRRLDEDHPAPAILTQIVAKYRFRADLDNTEKYTSMLLSTDPENSAGYNAAVLELLAGLQGDKENYEKQRTTLEQLIHSYPETRQAKTAWRDIVDVVDILGDKEGAAALLREYIRKYPTARDKFTDAKLFDLTGDIDY